MVDLARRTVVRTVDFPAGSKPYMLRVTPDGKEAWVLTVGAQTAVVLDAETLAVLHTEGTGKGPVQCAVVPGGRYGLMTMCEAGGMANATILERLG